MNASDAQADIHIHPLDLLFDRCCTLADRAKSGEVAFIDAVDMAYSAADWAGLVDRFGDYEVQAVLAIAFMGVPRTCTK
jgi:hypothetical protein